MPVGCANPVECAAPEVVLEKAKPCVMGYGLCVGLIDVEGSIILDVAKTEDKILALEELCFVLHAVSLTLNIMSTTHGL